MEQENAMKKQIQGYDGLYSVDETGTIYGQKWKPRRKVKNMENKKDYIAKWQKESTKIIPVRLNLNKDRDILTKLDAVPSKSGYIKKLIRKDAKNGL